MTDPVDADLAEQPAQREQSEDYGDDGHHRPEPAGVAVRELPGGGQQQRLAARGRRS